MPPAPDTEESTAPLLADLLASLAALGRSFGEGFAPGRFLGEFSTRIQRVVPHDRLVIACLDEDARTFTIFAEHAPDGPLVHADHYTSSSALGQRYVVADWTIRPVFAGEPVLVRDVESDPRFVDSSPAEWRVRDAGYRSAVLVPLRSAGRVIGALAASNTTPWTYDGTHVDVAGRVADLIAPFIENAILLQRERRRMERLRGLSALPRVLGASLDVRGVFDRLAQAVRPILDFEVMGITLISSSGRDLEILAEAVLAEDIASEPTPERIPLDAFSFSPRVESGQPVIVYDAARELDPRLAGDRLIIDGGGRSCLSVPLWLGERVAGALYFGHGRPHAFGASDVEIATAVASPLVMVIQHQRLAEEQRRLALLQERAQRLEQRVESLEDALGERYGFDQVIGRAAPLRGALDLASKVAPTETTALVTGESGTGKELVARAIHHASPRRRGPFVAVNCAALPDSLLESELFGHERGAFTGADRQRAGRFEVARGGTLFLDEIGELSTAVQAKLLRVLQEREFQRVGGTTTIRADVRLIAATNRDLARDIETGRFREDLFYRLNVFSVPLPPLRERGDDVLFLADHFLKVLGERMGRGDVGLSREARDALRAHPWPGNIRELQNAVERALIVSEGSLITAAQLGLRPGAAAAERPPGAQALGAGQSPVQSLADWERQIVIDALRAARGNKSRAAGMLGLTRSQLYTRLKRFGIDD
jgi:transcriptional regulator with GAF, ATPase, and Fis domain